MMKNRLSKFTGIHAPEGAKWRILAGLLCFTILAILGGCSAGESEEITAPELRSHVEYLASDTLRGRYTGTPGVEQAENYIADTFAGLGLSPLPGEEDYFLEFELRSTSYKRTGTILIIDGVKYTLGEDFRPFPFSEEGEVASEVVFAGYGITAPEYDYDDYAGLDVTGKIVLLMRHEPDETGTTDRFEGERHTRHAYFQTKAENAADHGAVGMLLYTDPLHHTADDDLRAMPAYSFADAEPGGRRNTGNQIAEGFIAFHISRAVASVLLPGVDLSGLQLAVDSGEKIPGILDKEPDNRKVLMKQASDPSSSTIQARNVAAFLPGTAGDEEDWIVVGAHHDHIGSYTGGGDTIYNGADDNASGVAGVLELAEQFAVHPAGRGIVFITFGAEEIGLLGSYALDRYDSLDFDKIGLMLNLDMIGRNPDKPVKVYGNGFAEGLTGLVEEANEEHAVKIALQGRRYEPFSDIAVFHDNRVPFLMFFTGEHPDYHGPGDHAGKLKYDRMERLLRLSYDILGLAAGSERLPRYKP